MLLRLLGLGWCPDITPLDTTPWLTHVVVGLTPGRVAMKRSLPGQVRIGKLSRCYNQPSRSTQPSIPLGYK